MGASARVWVKGVVWVGCLLPLAALLYWFWTDDLTANPIDFITDTLGNWALRLLLASLALTPLRVLTGMAWQMTLRRLLGLFAFFYVALHFGVWIGLDHFFAWRQLGADIVKRPYITVGVAAFTLLLPLAATSTTGMIKRMGARNWKRLHRLAYVAAALAVLHYIWLAKKVLLAPWIYAAILALLLGIRLWDAARRRRARMWLTATPDI
ncbi:MAG TPA: protein-methionine-sulfoxide reductase heme-binding subunit MsrQ [Candidatus Limnocylindria bacterium]|nr:protein-methionine-sulfoxide reductase heme-binding subunit MsrQ [Candidatus Limnocylindria bacterium]